MANHRHTIRRDLSTCLLNVAIAAHELHQCLEEEWDIRKANLKRQGLYNVQAVLDSIRSDVTLICRDKIYSPVMISSIQGALSAFRPKSSEKQKVRSFPLNERGGAA
jgi:hypothetical protein